MTWESEHLKFNTIFFDLLTVRPEVAPIPESGLIVTETGSTVTLGCQVTKGKPAPEVTWHRRERKMPSGEETIRGLSITYTSVTRHHSGVYVCQADNGFGEPSTTTLKLDVQREFCFEPFLIWCASFIHTLLCWSKTQTRDSFPIF